MSECFACEKPYTENRQRNAEVSLSIRVGPETDTTGMSYCLECSRKIMQLDRDILMDGIEQHIESLLAGKKSVLSISEGLVRQIAGNLGASEKVTEALVERIFGKDWSGPPPEDSGLVMNRYANRDRLVVFVAMNLKDLWTFEAQG